MFSTVLAWALCVWEDKLRPWLLKVLKSVMLCVGAKMGSRPVSAQWLWHSYWGRGRVRVIPEKYHPQIKAVILSDRDRNETSGTAAFPNEHDLYTVMGGFCWRLERDGHLILTDLYDWHQRSDYSFEVKIFGVDVKIAGEDLKMMDGYTPFLTVAHIRPDVVPVFNGIPFPDLVDCPYAYKGLKGFSRVMLKHLTGDYVAGLASEIYDELSDPHKKIAHELAEKVGFKTGLLKLQKDDIPF